MRDDHDSGRVSQRIPERARLPVDRGKVRLEATQGDIGEHGNDVGDDVGPARRRGDSAGGRDGSGSPGSAVWRRDRRWRILDQRSCRLVVLIRGFDQAQERGFIEPRDDQVGVTKSVGRAVLVRDADGERAGPPGGGQARRAVFQNQQRAGRHGEPLGRQAVDLRVGLAAGHVLRGEDELKPIEQPVLGQEPVGVCPPRRGRDGQRQLRRAR